MTLRRIFGSTFFELIGVLMLMPVLTIQLAARGEPPWLIGLFGSSLYVAIFAITPFTARCTRRFGLRMVYVVSGCAPLLAVSVFLATTDLLCWALAVAVMGIFGGLRWVTAEAYVASAAPSASRGSVIGAFQTMVGACFVLGPLLLTFTGTDGLRPFLVSGGLLVLGLLSLVGLEDLHAPHDDAPQGEFLRLLRERPVLPLAALIGGCLESGPGTFLPLAALADGLTGRHAAALVTVLGIGGFIVQFPLGKLADRHASLALVRVCLWTGLAGAMLLIFREEALWILWPAAFLWGAAGGGIYTLAMITVGRNYANVALVGATAALVFSFSAGAALSPALTGLVMDWWPGQGFTVLMALLTLGGLCCMREPARS